MMILKKIKMPEIARLPDDRVSDAGAREIRGQLRDFITEVLWTAGHYCNLAIGHLDVNDDAGANYSMNLAEQHFKAARSTFVDLMNENLLTGK